MTDTIVAEPTITEDTVFNEVDTFRSFVDDTPLARENAPGMNVTFGDLLADASGNLILAALNDHEPGTPLTAGFIARVVVGELLEEIHDDEFVNSKFDRASLETAFPVFVEGVRSALEATLTTEPQTFTWEWTLGARTCKASLQGYLFDGVNTHRYLTVDYSIDGEREFSFGFKVSPSGFRQNVSC